MDQLDIKQIREQMKLSQTQFAALLGISAGTLRGWEQGRRKPEGPARVLLLVAARRYRDGPS
jgi:putative transcriptional regulator